MSQIDKLISRLCSKPKDFTWDELEKVVAARGFVLLKGGKTGGSRRKFYNETTKEILDLHKPHPGNILKAYQLALFIDKLNLCQPPA